MYTVGQKLRWWWYVCLSHTNILVADRAAPNIRVLEYLNTRAQKGRGLLLSLKGTLTLKIYYLKWTIMWNKVKFCVGHETDDGVLWTKIHDDKRETEVVITGNSRYVYFYLWFVVY